MLLHFPLWEFASAQIFPQTFLTLSNCNGTVSVQEVPFHNLSVRAVPPCGPATNGRIIFPYSSEGEIDQTTLQQEQMNVLYNSKKATTKKPSFTCKIQILNCCLFTHNYFFKKYVVFSLWWNCMSFNKMLSNTLSQSCMCVPLNFKNLCTCHHCHQWIELL